MFTRPRFYHPHKASAPLSPAGIRIADYLNAPKPCFNLFTNPNTHTPPPTPFGGPPPHPEEDDAPPTMRLADLLARDFPERPSTLPRTQNATPNMNGINTPAMDPPPNPLHPKGKRRGPKHLSFTKGVHPHRCARKRFHDRHAKGRKGIVNLCREAEELMKPEFMDEQDMIFLQQLQKLQLNDELQLDLERCRERVLRAADESEERRCEHEMRDKEAERLWGKGSKQEGKQERKVADFLRAKEKRRRADRRRKEQAALRADAERQRAHDAMERKIREDQERIFFQELERKAKAEQKRKAKEEQARRSRQLQEEIQRLRTDIRERAVREERDRQERMEKERLFQQERERQHMRDAHARFLRTEQERLAREEAERQRRQAAQDEQARQHFVLYEAKWNELWTSDSIHDIDVQEMPWPVFGVISSADQVTYQDVCAFLLHPQRPGVEGKTLRDKVMSEVVRFHPDKFNQRVVQKIKSDQREIAKEIAGAVTSILTGIKQK